MENRVTLFFHSAHLQKAEAIMPHSLFCFLHIVIDPYKSYVQLYRFLIAVDQRLRIPKQRQDDKHDDGGEN
jgi:hypothetical protein